MEKYFKHPYESVIWNAEHDYKNIHYRQAKRLCKEAIRLARNESEIDRAKKLLVNVDKAMKAVK